MVHPRAVVEPKQVLRWHNCGVRDRHQSQADQAPVYLVPARTGVVQDVLPGSLRFLVQWISNDIARGVMALWIILNGVAAVYYGTLRVFVRKARAKID